MRGQLTIVKQGRRVALPVQGAFTIGRSPDCGLSLDDKLISRTHCQIDCDGEFFWLTDLNSKGGTHLNDAPIQKALLYDEDELRVGQTRLAFSLTDGPAPAREAPLDYGGSAAAAQPQWQPPADFDPADLEGQVLGGCRIEKRLDTRGTASVYEATQLSMQRRVAMKILPAPPDQDLTSEQWQAVVDRFLRGARSAGRLNHSNIVTIFDVGVVDGLAYLVMEFVEATTLKSVLRHHSKKQEPLDLYTALMIAGHIARGLDHAYRKRIVHRNIKPRNILVDREGMAKLAGFGQARSMDDERALLGGDWEHDDVLNYMAPEQGMPDGVVDHRSDIYSLGAVLFHMLANEPPALARSQGDELVWPDSASRVQDAVRSICEKAMCPSKEGRFDTADEFRLALRGGRSEVRNGAADD